MKLLRSLAAFLCLMPAVAWAQGAKPPPGLRSGGTGDLTSMSVAPAGSTSTRFLSVATPAVGNQTAVAGSKMQIDNLYESGSLKLENEAGIWPTKTYTHFGFSKTFDNTNSPSSVGSPVAALFGYGVNNGSPGDVVGVMADCLVNTNNGICFGANPIARTAANITGAKLVGMEIDVEPASSATVASGAGLYLNAFNIAMPIPAIQMGGVGSGAFQNGLLCAAVTGSCNAAQTGMTAQSYMDTSGGTYANGAIVIGNQQIVRFKGATGKGDGYLTTDTNGFLQFNGGTGGITFRNNANTTNLFYLQDGTGDFNLAVASAAIVGPTGNLNLRGGGTAGAGTITLQSLLKPYPYTVATLPTCNTANRDGLAVVTDATSPTYRGALTGGGSVRTPVYCDGSSWTAH